MTFTVNKNKVSFNIEINLSDLFFNITHRSTSSFDEKDIKDYFNKNPKDLETYLKTCEKAIKNFGSDSLDENQLILDCVEKLETKMLKSISSKK